MKKLLITVALIFAVTLSFGVATYVEAQLPDTIDETETSCELVKPITYEGHNYSGETQFSENDGAGAVVCFLNIINRAANLVFYAMMLLVILMILLGAFFILTGGGSEDKVEKGKKYITYAMGGLFIALFAYAVPYVVSFVMG